ncbi:alpha/beta fold hydrolase [Thioclava litoralis]|uniref:alpha/beta fold hydrolase n=1 Tax=Thioclava litoralis TaxID=3076557 RepID=UPI00338F3F5D
MGDGDPIILVHGFPWSAQAWRRIAPWLARTHRVYFFDMLGTGLSEKSSDQSVAESVQSDLLAALIGHWRLDKPQVVGHDFGGLASLRAHFVNGVPYGKLHLINAVGVRLSVLRSCAPARGSVCGSARLCPRGAVSRLYPECSALSPPRGVHPPLLRALVGRGGQSCLLSADRTGRYGEHRGSAGTLWQDRLRRSPDLG